MDRSGPRGGAAQADGAPGQPASAGDAQRRLERDRLVRIGAVGLALGLLAAVVSQRFPYGLIPGDAFTYLAAGERLNAGHQLYALSPGDRLVEMEPPYWSVPLVSPPPIAVLWRPLAALPNELGVYLWWAAHIVAVMTAFTLVAARRPVIASAALIALVFPFAYELSVANLNGFLLLALILAWRATARGSERSAGALAGILTAFKVTPALLGWWLLTARRWQAIRAGVTAGVVVLAISILGAGLDAHLAFLSIVRDTATSGARPLSLGGLGAALGVPPDIARLLPVAALVAGIAAVWLLRRRPDRAFQIAILTLILGSPTVSISWYALLFAAIAPLAWPWQGDVAGPGEMREAAVPGSIVVSS